jgi:hypothetical protein
MAAATAAAAVHRVSMLLQKLRLYSCAGRQLAILSLQGPPVALVAAGGVQGLGILGEGVESAALSQPCSRCLMRWICFTGFSKCDKVAAQHAAETAAVAG